MRPPRNSKRRLNSKLSLDEWETTGVKGVQDRTAGDVKVQKRKRVVKSNRKTAQQGSTKNVGTPRKDSSRTREQIKKDVREKRKVKPMVAPSARRPVGRQVSEAFHEMSESDQNIEAAVRGARGEGKQSLEKKRQSVPKKKAASIGGENNEMWKQESDSEPGKLQQSENSCQSDLLILEGLDKKAVPRKRGRPKGSKNKNKSAVHNPKGELTNETTAKRKRGQKTRIENVDESKGGSQKGARKKALQVQRKYLDRIQDGGTIFEMGDYVYVKKSDKAGEESDEELEECRVCGKCATEGEGDMLECDACLGGFHLGCLEPPLTDVPDGDWFCPVCLGQECGDWAKRQRRRTARERYLAGELFMAKINMLWQDPNGEYSCRGNWVDIPEETHMGRREHNHRREVFLSTLEDDISMDSIVRHAWVYPREKFERAANEGDDIYLLEYGYCPRTQRYKRIDEIADDGRGWNYELNDDDGDFQPLMEDEGSSDDGDFSADEAENEAKRGRKRKASSGKRKRKERAEPASRTLSAQRQRMEALAQLGAKEIPAAARKKTLTKLEAAQAALALAALPKKLSCRDKERQQVEAFVEEAVSAGSECLGSCLYISGVPGTGKTATVLEVMRGLRKRVDAKELPPFQFVEINALRVPSPAHVYSSLHEALTGEYLGPKIALDKLQQRFSEEPRGKRGSARRPLVVLVDELDLLVTRNQSVLYNIFDWPTLPNSRLIVIGIANTIDLPERMLPRIASRMGLRRVAFSPYTREQLQEIVADRLAGIPAFRSEAIELASRKVASASGDVRRALELCRRAAEIASARHKKALTSAADVVCPAAESGPPEAVKTQRLGEGLEEVMVELMDVDGAVREMFDSPHIKSIERFSRHEQILLMALVVVMRQTGIAETNFESVTTAHVDMCRAHGEQPPTHGNLSELVSRLGASHVLISESGHRHRLRKIELNVPSDDVTFALKRFAQVSWLKKLAEQRV